MGSHDIGTVIFVCCVAFIVVLILGALMSVGGGDEAEEYDDGGTFPDAGGVRRRYMPIGITRRIDIDRVRADRDQIFAEAVLAYVSGEKWHLAPEEQEVANRQVEERMVESSWTAKISEWWFGMSPAQRPAELQTHTIAERALHFTADKINRDVETKIGSAMSKFKDTDLRPSFKKRRLTRNGVLQYLYFPSDEVRSALQSSNRAVLRPVSAIFGAQARA